jgi:hypothetical protein
MLLFLFALVAFAFIAFFVVIATVGVTIASLATLVTAPRQLWSLLRNRTLRRNHALEHATINVIEERLGQSRLAGLAHDDGFEIRGGAPPDLVASAAEEALRRLRQGERRLAIHPRCGTTLVAAQLVMAITFLVVLALMGQLTWWPFLAGLLAALILGPRLSLLMQRFITTDTKVGDLQLVGVEVQRPTGRMGLVTMLTMGPIFVRTAEVATEKSGRMTVITGDREEIAAGGYRYR